MWQFFVSYPKSGAHLHTDDQCTGCILIIKPEGGIRVKTHPWPGSLFLWLLMGTDHENRE